MPASYRFVVAGRVQGVGFRIATRRKASALGLGGWVGNRADGAVEGVVDGEPQRLAAFRDWLNQGPPSAQVTAVEWLAVADFIAVGSGFHIHD